MSIGCKYSSSDSSGSSENAIEFNGKYTLVETGKIVLPLDDNTSFNHNSIHYSMVGPTGYISFINRNNKSVYYYSLDSLVPHKIILQEEGPDGVGTLSSSSAHFFKSPNEIYILNKENGRFFRIDSTSRVISRYPLVDYDYYPYSTYPDPSAIAPIYNKGSSFYFTGHIDNSKKDFLTHGGIVKYDTLTREMDLLYIFPDVYHENFWGSPFKYQTYFTINEKDEMIISNPLSHDVRVGDLSGRLLSEHYVRSEFVKDVPPMYEDIEYAFSENRDFDKENDYSFSHSDYMTMMYNNVEDVYYRLTYVRPNLEQVQSKTGKTDFSVIILDKTFKKLGEERFSSDIYDTWMILNSELGLLLARKDLYAENEDELVFSIFNLEEIDG